MLKKHGIQRVHPLEGGFDAWRAAGYRVEVLSRSAAAPHSNPAGPSPRNLGILLILGLLSIGLATAAEPVPSELTSEKVLRYLGFTPAEQEALQRGEITSHEVKELSEKELAITVAVLVPAPLERLLEYLRSDRPLQINRDVLAYGILPTRAGDAGITAAFGKLDLAPSEMGEIRSLLQADPISRFNLSESETKVFARLGKTFSVKECDKDPRCIDAVLAALRTMLRDRFDDYLGHGLDGIEPYARPNGGRADPAGELKKATDAARFLAEQYPGIFAAFRNFPADAISGFDSRFLWLKQTIQDRPTLILSHRILCQRDGIAFAAERQFYVGHSYNSLQILVGLVPLETKTLLVYLNRTSTDQVAGFMSGTRHSMGRKVMEKEIRRQFENELASVAGSGSRP